MVLRYGEDPTIRDREGRCPDDMVANRRVRTYFTLLASVGKGSDVVLRHIASSFDDPPRWTSTTLTAHAEAVDQTPFLSPNSHIARNRLPAG